jgi:hypothetical protein
MGFTLRDSVPLTNGITLLKLEREITMHFSRTILVAIVFTFVSTESKSNGLFENVPWQFSSPHETSTKAFVEDLIKKQKAGYYDQGSFINKHFNLGLNCSSDAMSIGNDGTNNIVTDIANSVGIEESAISASTIGNEHHMSKDNSRGESRNNQMNTESHLESGISGSSMTSGKQSTSAKDISHISKNRQRNDNSRFWSAANGNDVCNVAF